MSWIALITLVRREFSVVLQFWGVTLAPPVIATALYFTVFGKIIGGRVGSIDGVAYGEYVMPGLVVLSVIPSSYVHAASGLLGARVHRYIEELLVSPMQNGTIVAGYVFGGMLRGLMVASAVTLTSLVFVHPALHSVLVSITAVALGAWIAAVAGFMIGTVARSFEHVTAIQILVLVPLTFVGGVFAPISMLPSWAQWLSLANPMFHLVNALRFGVLGISHAPVGASLTFVASFAVVLSGLCVLFVTQGAGLRRESSNS
jgi:ABC-2 type transport system permease protein